MSQRNLGRLVATALCCAAVAPLTAAAPTGQEILDHAPAAAWQDIPAEDVVVMTLGDGGRVVLQLAPQFAPVHVANIRALVRYNSFDEGAAIVRVQDNYVVQWKAAELGSPPPKFFADPPAEYESTGTPPRFRALPYRDAYALHAGHVAGWPVATDGKASWLVHCYGMVGVGRDMPPDTGNGAELYAVIGHAPRQLDRNIALVGRVIDGIEHMTDRRRGTEAMGFYKTPAEQVPIRSTKIAADMPAATRPTYQVLNTNGATFASWVAARASRRDPFFIKPANAVDVCNVTPPIRKKP